MTRRTVAPSPVTPPGGHVSRYRDRIFDVRPHDPYRVPEKYAVPRRCPQCGAVYERKRQALAVYQSIFRPVDDRLLALYEAEDRYYGRMLGVACAEIFRSAAPLLVETPTVFRPAVHG